MAKKKKQAELTVVKANLKYVRVSPYKLRKVADEVRDLTALEAIAKLRIMTQKSATILYKLFKSCVANATHNNQLDEATLKVDRLVVNEGPRLKRHQARARGRIFGITKPYSHVELALNNQGVIHGSKG